LREKAASRLAGIPRISRRINGTVGDCVSARAIPRSIVESGDLIPGLTASRRTVTMCVLWHVAASAKLRWDDWAEDNGGTGRASALNHGTSAHFPWRIWAKS